METKNKIAIIGANVAGLGSAIAIKEKRPDIDVIVYDKNGIWNKPCGDAISVEFNEELEARGIYLNEAEYSDELIIGSFAKRAVTSRSPFVITTREDLQENLLLYAIAEHGINYQKRFIRPKDIEFFTPQTIVASGYTGVTHSLLNRKWNKNDVTRIIRWDGNLTGSSAVYPRKQILLVDTKNIGYGWVFIGAGSHVNIGYGSVMKTPIKTIIKQYYAFVDILNDDYGFNLGHYDVGNYESWGLPLPVKKKVKVSNFKNGIEFIGVGDALGLAHPTLGAGIEPAWLSARLIGDCLQTNGLIDTKLYQKLVWKNARNVIMPNKDYYYARLFRSKFFRWTPVWLRRRLFNRIIDSHQPKMLEQWRIHPMFIPLQN